MTGEQETRATQDGGGTPSPQSGGRVRESLEMVKTALVWLVVVQILTVLSPLLWLPLKWALIVGTILTASSFLIGAVAYLRARRTQRSIPD